MDFGISPAEAGNVGSESRFVEAAKHGVKLFAQDEPDDKQGKFLKLRGLAQDATEDLGCFAISQFTSSNLDFFSDEFGGTLEGQGDNCPFGPLGNEVTDSDELIRPDVSLIFEVIKNKLAAFFVKEKAKKRLARQAHAEDMADFCIATIQGAMLMGKIKRSRQTV